MKCKFNSSLDCRETFSNCSLCSLFYNKTLDGLQNHLKGFIGNEIVFCPFCLTMRTYKEFVINKRLLQCPECHNNMRESSLIISSDSSSIFGYVLWVYDYGREFWKKIDFKLFNDRLKTYGISRLFWDEYKRLKGQVKRMM